MVFIPSTEVALNFSAALSKWTNGRGLSAKLDAIDSFIQMADARMPKTKDENRKKIIMFPANFGSSFEMYETN